MRGNREQGVGSSVRKLNQLAAFGAMAATLVLAGCRQDMQDQPKFFPQRGTDFYADGRSVRPQVENTVARGQLRENAYFYTGLINGKEGDGMPFPATLEVLERGQERYNVYCTPCHGLTGDGDGMIVQRGFRRPPSLHEERLRTAPVGHLFEVITNGFGVMYPYGYRVPPRDRWAIISYIRALQLTRQVSINDLPEAERQKLQSVQ